MRSDPPSKILIALAFFAIYVVWGTTYLAALWGLEGMEPFVLSSLRYLLAGVLLAMWCLVSRYAWPDFSSVKVVAVTGIVMLVGGSGLVVVAEKYISSGHAAVVIATEPLWFLLLDRKRWKEYFSNPFVIAGLVTGFAGIALFSCFSPEQTGIAYNAVTGTLIALGGSILWVIGALYYERSPGIKKHPHLVLTTIQLLCAGAFSAGLALALGEWNKFHVHDVTGNAWFGLIFLAIMGSIVAYVAFMWLMKVQPPAIVSTHTYVNPVVAVFVGWLLADERITLLQFFSLLIVLAGVLMTRIKTRRIST